MPRELHDALAQGKHDKVMRETWGHLAPERGRRYTGHIIVAHGAYGDLIPFRVYFDGLPDSPWFYQDMLDFVDEWETEEGNLYRFDGTYTLFKNGHCRFSGKVKALPV